MEEDILLEEALFPEVEKPEDYPAWKARMKEENRARRKQMSPLGWSLLIYMLIMTLCVYLVMAMDTALRIAGGANPDDPAVRQAIAGNGIGYLVAIVIGMFLMRWWKGREFCEETLWTQGKPMYPGEFFRLLALFLGGQMAFQLITIVLELIMNQLGLSLLSSVESAQMPKDSITLFIYAGIAAPVAEELLFRGLVLRSLEPMGKRLAIFLSAFAFAIFHGNLVQTPYAFLVGLVLGYVAVEYNIVWAMVLHMINNLLLGDTLGRLLESMPETVAGLVTVFVVWACGIAGIIILAVYREDVAEYHEKYPIDWSYVRAFVTTPGAIILMALLAISAASPLITQLLG